MGLGMNFGSNSVYQLRVDSFKGVDFAQSPVGVSASRSPNAVNVISDLAGKPVKRTGSKLMGLLDERINGIYYFLDKNAKKVLVHCGSKLYEWIKEEDENLKESSRISGDVFNLIKDQINDERSYAVQYDGVLWFLDGVNFYRYFYDEDSSEYKFELVSENAYVPTTRIGANVDGSEGESFEDVNVLSKKRKNSFYVSESNASSKTFVLEKTNLCDDVKVWAEVLGSDGEWKTINESSGLSVDRVKGSVTFLTAPGKAINLGEDNVIIGFGVEDDEVDLEKIGACKFGMLFGADGGSDRLFLSGNDEYRNYDFYSQSDDLSYFPKMNYTKLGDEACAVMGYSRIGNVMVVHKEDKGEDNSVFFRSGALDNDGDVVFSIIGGIGGAGAVSRHGFAVFNTEPMFVSNEGVFAVTTADITGDKYAEVRSYYVNPKLRNENLREAVGVQFKNYYYLAVGGNCYVADGRQRVYESNAPMSSYQYEWYFFDNVPSRVWFVYEDRLFFGTENGEIFRFFDVSEESAVNNIYKDDGDNVCAIWDTPYFSFNKIGYLKRLLGFWLMLAPFKRSGVEIFYRYEGERFKVREASADIFDFENVNFERFTFNIDDSPLVVASNKGLRRFMLIQFRFVNDKAEGFGFYGFEAQYNLQGKYRYM